jgi:hypothetical protein
MLAKALSRGRVEQTCSDCRAKRAYQVGRCRPYQGELDLDTLQPMKNGKPFRPGTRLCGNADCVADKHIEKPFDFEETYARIMGEQTGYGKFAEVCERITRELAVGVGERK